MATIAAQQAARWKQLELPALIALAVGGAAIGFGIVSVGGLPEKGTLPGSSLGSHFRALGEFRLWVFLIAAQTALWTIGAAVFLAPELRRPLDRWWSEAREAVAVTVIAAGIPLVSFVVVASLNSTLHYPLPWHKWKVLALSLIAIGVALLGVAELAAVKFALQHQPARGSLADIQAFLGLRTLLQRILAVEGAIIGAAVLSTGALRNAVIAYNPAVKSYNAHHLPADRLPISLFPREYVLTYGAFFTLLLAVLYAPVYFRLVEVGRKNIDAACKDEEPGSGAWLATYEKRKKLEEYLQLEVTTSAGFRSGVAILTPLASALVALLLGAA